MVCNKKELDLKIKRDLISDFDLYLFYIIFPNFEINNLKIN